MLTELEIYDIIKKACSFVAIQDREDAVQVAMIEAMGYQDDLPDDIDEATAYVKSSSKRAARRYLKSVSKAKEVLDPYAYAEARQNDSQSDLKQVDNKDELHYAISKLDDITMDIVTSAYGINRRVETHGEIGERLGLSRQRVGQLLNRTLGELKDLL